MLWPKPVSRREMLKTTVCATLAGSVLSSLAWARAKPFAEPARTPFPGTDDQLLEEAQRRAFDFFWNQASANTGLVKDRARANGTDNRRAASIAATGFGLTALCIAAARGYGDAADVQTRTKKTLRFLAQMPNEHGFFYHFIDIESGQRARGSEVSSIDTTLLLCGVLTARQYFSDAEIQDLATTIYERVDWQWMLNGSDLFSMGWMPEGGFLHSRWTHYCELMMLNLLALGSPTHAVPSETWAAWMRPTVKFQEFEFIAAHDPVFGHQYSHAGFDFRHKRDEFADYFQNSVIATKAHKQFCISLHAEFPDYSDHLWGITASDSVSGYQAWGGPPRIGLLDGSVVPCAAGGSLPFLEDDCIQVLRTIRERYPQAYGRYGFVDAFNPLTNWYNPDVIGIDMGITMVMAENARTGLIWETFMKNREARRGMERAGFKTETGFKGSEMQGFKDRDAVLESDKILR
jgi:hypothetical protein